ncbi:MAG: hypothetical protein KBC56_06915 [Flavobacterium sp.]|nr:hypothetical protein [Flavobacterium sp.]
MKNLFFGLVATLLISNASFGQNFEESVAIKIGNRIAAKNSGLTKSARTFTLVNYESAYKLLPYYVLNGVDFTDDGKYNDVIAGDGIYTSVELLPNVKSKTDLSEIYLMSDKFRYGDNLTSAKGKIKVGCKIRYVRKGKSLLGDDCATNCCGCIEFYDCEISIEFEW